MAWAPVEQELKPHLARGRIDDIDAQQDQFVRPEARAGENRHADGLLPHFLPSGAWKLGDDPVDQAYIDELQHRFADFRRAYEPDGLAVDEFDSFPPTIRTLRTFISSYHDLLAAVTDAQLPNPDVKG